MEHLARRTGGAGTPRRSGLTAVLLWIAAGVAATVGTALGTRVTALAGQAGRARVDALVELAVLAAGVAVLAWLLVSCVVAAGCLTARAGGSGWRGGERWVRRWAPSAVRRAVVLAVGAGIGLSAATGASAADVLPSGSPSPSVSAAAVPSREVDLGWVPTGDSSSAPSVDRPSSAPTAAASSAPTGAGGVGGVRVQAGAGAAAGVTSETSQGLVRRAAETSTRAEASLRDEAGGPARTAAGADRGPSGPSPSGERVPASATRTLTVAPGDTLWAIAARHLPPGADDTSVAAAWPAWYAANAATIGGDPNLIRPGQVLTVPADAGVAS